MLKLIAAILMFMDHFALAFFDSASLLYFIFRLLGRLAMPIFAYKIACGFYYTRDIKRYAKRIAIMTLMAQIPFTLLVYTDSFFSMVSETNGLCLLYFGNIGLTFLCSLGILYSFQKCKEIISSTSSIFSTFPYIVLTFICLILVSFGDYGMYGLLMVIFFYLSIQQKWSITKTFLTLFVLTCFVSAPLGLDYLVSARLPALLSIVLIYNIDDKKEILSSSFFYYFYPLHMFILGILAYIF
ncbi:MAG: TraX family protein [Cellulosilyticaceae bacterium]